MKRRKEGRKEGRKKKEMRRREEGRRLDKRKLCTHDYTASLMTHFYFHSLVFTSDASTRASINSLC